MDDINLFEDERAPARRLEGEKGGFFIVNLTCMRTLWQLELSFTELAAYLVLAAATDRSNVISMAGKKSLRSTLGISDRGAEATLARLVETGAIVSLPDHRRKGPGLPRYRLLPIAVEKSPAECDVIEPCQVSETSPSGPLDPKHNVLIPNGFVSPRGDVSSALQMIVRYGTPAMLWAALCSFAKQEVVHFLPSPTHADEGGPALGPLYLRPFVIRPLRLTMAEGADPLGLQSDFVGLLNLDLGVWDLYWLRDPLNHETSEFLPVATLRNGQPDLAAPTSALSVVTFWLATREHEAGDIEASPSIKSVIEAWKTSARQVAVVPATATGGTMVALPRLDCTRMTAQGRQDHEQHLQSGRQALSDVLRMIGRYKPECLPFAKALSAAIGEQVRVSKVKE